MTNKGSIKEHLAKYGLVLCHKNSEIEITEYTFRFDCLRMVKTSHVLPCPCIEASGILVQWFKPNTIKVTINGIVRPINDIYEMGFEGHMRSFEEGLKKIMENWWRS